MSAAASLAELLAERRRREAAREAEAARIAAEKQAEEEQEVKAQAVLGERYRTIAGGIRGTLYDKQRQAFLDADSRRMAALCTRRAGKTFGGIREFVAYALENPKSRQLYINETRDEAKALAWDEPDDGIVSVLAAFGLVRGEKRGDDGDFWANETELIVRFRNGSVIKLFGADDERQIDKLRGRKWNRAWIDEAGKLRHLQALIQRILGASMADFDGQIWITLTPSLDAAGYAYDVTRQDGQRAPGWTVYEWSVVDNPFFGSTAEERWARTAAVALKENGWTAEDPDFQREWLGRWVISDANYVYPVHAVIDQAKLVFAPVRIKDGALSDGKPVADLYDHKKARADLPINRRGQPHVWLYSMGLDFGFDPDGFSIVLLAFAMTHDICYEMYSWKKTKTDTYEQKDRVKHVLDQLDAENDPIVSIVGDPAGTRSLLKGWRERALIPIEEAEKNEKDTWIDLLGADIRRGRFAYRGVPGTGSTPKIDSQLLDEHRHLVWLPVKNGKRVAHKHRKLLDGRIPGDHCSDGNLYGWRHASNWLAQRDDAPTPPDSPEALAAESRKHVDQLEELAKQRAAEMAWSPDEWRY